MKNVEIIREGEGRHRAGHVWVLKINGKHIGVYETKRQARERAEQEN